ncbi:hypothetical protein [Pseudoalteromonas sp. T1lg10]|uniref:hypothetical protein n=1 Tax=Pseudoalteromonas sp. T1lg10 TaxID=2077093 RepID=UPI000CF638F6|nr:hypothetical protein [Pseudoalteromonas sp. T1lg10]
MKNIKSTLSSLLLTATLSCTLVSQVQAETNQSFTLYDDPLLLQPYVTEPAKVIKLGMNQYQWRSVNQTPDTIEAELDYKGYVLRVDIHYNSEKIWFEAISSVNNDCKKPPCEVEQRHIDRWRTGLRRGIAKAITDLAVKDAYQQVYLDKPEP